MHSARLITICLMTICTVALLLWDGHCLANSETEDTVSECVRAANKASGGLVGLLSIALVVHFFFQGILPESWK